MQHNGKLLLRHRRYSERVAQTLWLQLHQWLESLSVAQQTASSGGLPWLLPLQVQVRPLRSPIFHIFPFFMCVQPQNKGLLYRHLSTLGFICPWVAFFLPLLCAPAFLRFSHEM